MFSWSSVFISISGFSLRGKPYPNHGLVLRDLIGENDGDPDNRLHCISDLADCCSPGTMFRGEFYYPDGSKVQSSINDPYYGIYYRSRGSDRIFLNRHNVMGVIIKEGLFRCQIRSLSSPITPEDYYIGVYTTASG